MQLSIKNRILHVFFPISHSSIPTVNCLILEDMNRLPYDVELVGPEFGLGTFHAMAVGSNC